MSWFCNWSPLQRNRVLEKLEAHCKGKMSEEDLLESLQRMNVGGASPAVFDCQVKMLLGWWDGWTQMARETVLNHFQRVTSNVGE